MNRKLTLRNMAFTVALQVVTIISGFILPRIILSYFGSEVNGLVASISQFLNYIQLIEGGLTGVIMAALYKALAANDEEKVSAIIVAANNFFRKVGMIFVLYAATVAVIYPFISNASFSYPYVVSLAMILAINTFVQYFFSISYRILITANRHGYIVSLIQIIFIIINLLLVIASVKICPNIHLLKAVSTVAFLVQPIAFGMYVKKHFKINSKSKPDNQAINQRWDGFGQNLAFFIHTNTDMVILTIFTNLSIVSVYSVYALITNAVKNLIVAVSGAIQPSFGNVLASNDRKRINEVYDIYEFGISLLTSFVFSCCLVLIVPFVAIYTKGVKDANYYQPLFALFIVIAEGVYCLRDPYVAVAYVAGRFRETSIYAYLEAVINIGISLCLVRSLGMVGVAVGTTVAMLYRMVAHIIYAKKHVINRPISKSISSIMMFVFCMGGTFLVSRTFKYEISSYVEWIVYAAVTMIVVSVILVGYSLVFNRKKFFMLYRKVKGSVR